jgi:hypothetical protein
MKRNAIFLVLLSAILYACNGNKQMLVGTWRVVDWENPYYDSFFTNAQKYIDTVGKGHDDSTNMRLYGVANMDSMRHVLQLQYDSAKSMQEGSVSNTVFTFFKNGRGQITLAGKTDSCKWLLDNDNGLILEEAGGGNNQAVSRYHIVALTEKELKLRFFEEGDSSTVTFSHDGK